MKKMNLNTFVTRIFMLTFLNVAWSSPDLDDEYLDYLSKFGNSMMELSDESKHQDEKPLKTLDEENGETNSETEIENDLALIREQPIEKIPFINKVPHNNDPHYYKPLPLPVHDAIKFARKYGPLNDEKPEKSEAHKRSVLACIRRKRDDECERDVNGCGSGFTESIPLLYRPQITPSCNKHDVCYDCGFTRHWTRKQCDDTFYHDMISACNCVYDGNNWFQYGQRKACKYVAYSLWIAVRKFSETYFGKEILTRCKKDCIIPYGSPNSTLLV